MLSRPGGGDNSTNCRKVLALLAQRLREVVREGDVVARRGGDEFAVLQYQVGTFDTALGLAGRLVRGIEKPMQVELHTLQVGASVGIALSSAEGCDPDTLLRNADAAMYAAKASEADNVRVFDGAQRGAAEQVRLPTDSTPSGP